MRRGSTPPRHPSRRGRWTFDHWALQRDGDPQWAVAPANPEEKAADCGRQFDLGLIDASAVAVRFNERQLDCIPSLHENFARPSDMFGTLEPHAAGFANGSVVDSPSSRHCLVRATAHTGVFLHETELK